MSLLIVVCGLLVISPPQASASTRDDSAGTVELAAAGWLDGGGADVLSNGNNARNNNGNSCVAHSGAPGGSGCPAGTVFAGELWQCVELINRLYLNRGWITSTWTGNGNTIKDHLPTGLTYQANGSITSLKPGDIVTLDDGGDGHAGVVNNVVGTSVQIVNQNTIDVYSMGTLSGNTLTMSGWAGYTVQGVIHRPAGPSGGTSRADNDRIAQSSGTQYIFQRGAALPISYGDAGRYDSEGNTYVYTNYTTALPSATLPDNTVLRPVGSGAQYLWGNGALHSIGDGATSACLLFAIPQGNGTPAVVPADWMATLPVGSAALCSLPDGTRFTQTDTGAQQYVSVRGAALTVSYGDAVTYNGEGNTAVTNMPTGYTQASIHAAVVPANTVLRAAGSSSQFFWDGSQLHSVADATTSQCLLVAFPQNSVAVAPPSWVSARTTGAAQQCSLADGTRFTQTDQGSQQYISVRGAALPVSYADAVKYNTEENLNVLMMQAGYIQDSIHAATLPTNTVLRAVGSASQFFWDGSTLHSVPDTTTSGCLLAAHPQNGVAVVPADWMATLTTGAAQTCS